MINCLTSIVVLFFYSVVNNSQDSTTSKLSVSHLVNLKTVLVWSVVRGGILRKFENIYKNIIRYLMKGRLKKWEVED